jgi:hypothetical protein
MGHPKQCTGEAAQKMRNEGFIIGRSATIKNPGRPQFAAKNRNYLLESQLNVSDNFNRETSRQTP